MFLLVISTNTFSLLFFFFYFFFNSLYRGNLNLTVLPTSDFRLSFGGDDGNTERLFILSSKSQCSSMIIEEIAADNSGRSFLIKVPDGQTFYFWCSEKSKLLGIELLSKVQFTILMNLARLRGHARIDYLSE